MVFSALKMRTSTLFLSKLFRGATAPHTLRKIGGLRLRPHVGGSRLRVRYDDLAEFIGGFKSQVASRV